MKKQILSALLAIVIIIGTMPFITASAATNYKARTTSEIGINFIEAFEGYARYAFWDYEHYTIGYGNTCTKNEYPGGISEEEAHNLFIKLLPSYESGLNSFLKTNDIYVTQNQYDALLSFTFNFGAYVWNQNPTIAKYLKNGISKYTDEQISNAFGLWVNAGGVKNEGLVIRRAAEAVLFCTDDFTPIQETYVLTTDTTVRKGAGIGYASVGTLKKGKVVVVTAKKLIGTYTWGRISYSGSDRWVSLGSSKFAKVDNTSSSQFCLPTLYSVKNSAKGVTLTWSKVPGATGYYVYKKSNSTDSFALYRTIKSNSTVTFTDTSVSNGKSYYYYVKSYNSTKTSNASSWAHITFVTAPTLSSTTKLSNGIKITWVKQSGASGYYIMRKYATEDSYSRIATVTSSTNSYSDTKCAGGNYNYYSVESFNSQGISGFKSGLKNIYIGKTSVSSSVNGTENLKINWSSVSGATGYKIYRKVSGGSYKLVKTITSSSILSWTDTSLNPSKTYYYEINAYSSHITGTSGSSFKAVFAKPPVISSVSNVSTGLKVTWKKVSGATKYRVYRKVSGGSYSLVKTISSGSTTSWTDTSVTSGKTYYYKLITIESNCYSYKSSAEKIVCIKAPTFTWSTVTSSGLKLKWSAISGAKHYTLYKKQDNKFVKLDTTSSNIYTDKEATKNGTYYYKISVTTDEGTSQESSVFNAYHLAKTTIKISSSSNGLLLSWSKVVNATGYVIYRRLSTDDSYSKYTTVSTDKLTFDNTTCVSGKTYYYIIKAIKSKSYSNNSNVVYKKKS